VALFGRRSKEPDSGGRAADDDTTAGPGDAQPPPRAVARHAADGTYYADGSWVPSGPDPSYVGDGSPYGYAGAGDPYGRQPYAVDPMVAYGYPLPADGGDDREPPSPPVGSSPEVVGSSAEVVDQSPELARPSVLYELETDSPRIGKVMARPPAKAEPGHQLRPPAVTLDGAVVPGFAVAAASCIGFKHEYEGSVRQDAYGFTPTPGGQLVLAVADGLGSRGASQLGAAAFCEGVVLAAARAEEPLDPADLLRRGENWAKTVAHTYRLTERDVGFVAAVAVLGPSTTGLARVGDVSAFTLRDGRFVELFVEEDAGPLNLVSASLPSADDAPVTPETASVPTEQLTVLVTDGLATDLRNSPVLGEWLAVEWSVSRGPFAFGNTLRYRRQASHDDRTAIAAWLSPDAVDQGTRTS
jgi:hypothetical protein